MHSTSHITVEMMESILKGAFSAPVTQEDKDAARHLRNLLTGTKAAYRSVIFDVMELAQRHDRNGLAEMAFLVGLQAGYELGIAHPSEKIGPGP